MKEKMDLGQNGKYKPTNNEDFWVGSKELERPLPTLWSNKGGGGDQDWTLGSAQKPPWEEGREGFKPFFTKAEAAIAAEKTQLE